MRDSTIKKEDAEADKKEDGTLMRRRSYVEEHRSGGASMP